MPGSGLYTAGTGGLSLVPLETSHNFIFSHQTQDPRRLARQSCFTSLVYQRAGQKGPTPHARLHRSQKPGFTKPLALHLRLRPGPCPPTLPELHTLPGAAPSVEMPRGFPPQQPPTPAAARMFALPLIPDILGTSAEPSDSCPGSGPSSESACSRDCSLTWLAKSR